MAGRWPDILRGYFRRRTATYLCVLIVFAMGVVFGGLAVGHVDETDRSALAQYVEGLLARGQARALAPAEEVMRQAVLDDLLKTVGLVGLLGLSVIGAPLVLGVVFLRGFVLGFTGAFLMDQMQLRGLVVALVSLLPHNVLAVPAVLVAGASAVGFSVTAARVLLGRRDIHISHHFLSTLLLLAASGAVLVAAAFVEAYVTPVLMDAVTRFLP
ncbi:MAG TPA: stage II sporulation protein M [Limnochordales bacterium]